MTNTIGSLRRADRLISRLVELEAAQVSTLAQELEMALSTAYDYISTLDSLGYVDAPVRRTLPGEYAVLMIEEDGLGVVLGRREGEKAGHSKVSQTYAGTRTRLNTTATGKAILSELPQTRIRSIVDEYGLSSKTGQTIADPKALFAELDRIREQGYAIDDEERLAGIRGIGVPVVSESDDIVAAIGLYGAANRFTETEREELSEKLLTVANEIQIQLSHS